MRADLDLVAAYLARRDVADLDEVDQVDGPFDVVVLLGSALLGPERTAARVLAGGTARRLLVCGGVGHSTELLWRAVEADPALSGVRTRGRPEAHVLVDVLVEHLDVPREGLLVEDRSTTCGSNATEARRVLAEHGVPSDRVLLLQDPTMQRRSHACFVRAWGDDRPFTSFAPSVPRVAGLGEDVEGGWTFDRFVGLLLGEVRRLHDDEDGYGPRGAGFIDHVDVPEEVLAAARRLRSRYPDLVR